MANPLAAAAAAAAEDLLRGYRPGGAVEHQRLAGIELADRRQRRAEGRVVGRREGDRVEVGRDLGAVELAQPGRVGGKRLGNDLGVRILAGQRHRGALDEERVLARGRRCRGVPFRAPDELIVGPRRARARDGGGGVELGWRARRDGRSEAPGCGRRAAPRASRRPPPERALPLAWRSRRGRLRPRHRAGRPCRAPAARRARPASRRARRAGRRRKERTAAGRRAGPAPSRRSAEGSRTDGALASSRHRSSVEWISNRGNYCR